MYTIVVVPCYNEERRLRADGFAQLLRADGVRLLFVNDGSTDGTEPALQALCATLGPRAGVLSLERNGGKAEAVRRGLLAAIEGGAQAVGYLDADLATPPREMLRVLEALWEGPAQAALGSRLSLLGSRIVRKPARRVLGRIFAAVASLVLGVRVRDTQCGAKAFRCSRALVHALAEPFHARWAFDVELIGRLLAGGPGVAPLGPELFIEVPLRAWNEVPGSTLRPAHFPLLGLELLRIHLALQHKRTAARELPAPEAAAAPALPVKVEGRDAA